MSVILLILDGVQVRELWDLSSFVISAGETYLVRIVSTYLLFQETHFWRIFGCLLLSKIILCILSALFILSAKTDMSYSVKDCFGLSF